MFSLINCGSFKITIMIQNLLFMVIFIVIIIIIILKSFCMCVFYVIIFSCLFPV